MYGDNSMRYSHLVMLSFFLAIFCTACALSDEPPEVLVSAETPAFQNTGDIPAPESPILSMPTTPTLAATCLPSEMRRCHGTVLQQCRQGRWEDFQRCESIEAQCSTRPADCAGLVNWGCCAP